MSIVFVHITLVLRTTNSCYQHRRMQIVSLCILLFDPATHWKFLAGFTARILLLRAHLHTLHTFFYTWSIEDVLLLVFITSRRRCNFIIITTLLEGQCFAWYLRVPFLSSLKSSLSRSVWAIDWIPRTLSLFTTSERVTKLMLVKTSHPCSNDWMKTSGTQVD